MLELLTVLGLMGLTIPILQAVKLRRSARKTLRIDGKVVGRALCWTVAGSLWTGIYAAWLFATVVEQGQFLEVSVLGKIAIWLGIPVFCAVLMVSGLLLELIQLHLYGLPRMRNRAESKSNHGDQQ